MAQKDLALMTQLIPQMPEHLWPELQEIRFATMAQQDPTRAATVLEELLAGDPIKNQKYKNAAEAVRAKFREVDPVAAANLSLRLYPRNYVQVGTDEEQQLYRQLSSWSGTDAAAWVLQQKGADAALVSYMFMKEFGGNALFNKTAEVMKNLEGADLNDSHLQRVLSQFAQHFRSAGEDKARQWLEGIDDPNLRAAAQTEMNRVWVRSDPVGASAWLAEAAPSPEKDVLIKTLVSRIDFEDPERAFVWSQKIADDPTRQESMIGVMASWLRRDPIQAAKALEQTSPEFQQAIKSALRKG
jgi:hypothetical protein